MSNAHEFETSVTWSGAKKGSLNAPELPGMDVASPPAFGGAPGLWTPEHLFVGSANVCVMMTFLAIAELSKLDVVSYRSDATGKLEKVEGQGYQFTDIEVRATIEVTESSDVERARRILEKAEKNCLVSKSMKTPVRVSAEIRAASA